MAFIGTPLDTRNTFQSLVGKRFSGDGSTTAFTLDVAPSSTLDIEVFVGNVRQDPNSAYTLSGTTLTFTGAPPSGTNNIYVVHQAKSVGTIGIPEDTISARTLVTLDNSNDHVLIEDATDGELKKALIPAASFAGIDDQSSSNDDQLTITDTAVVINEDSDDVDFRVESNGNANMLFVSGGNDVVGVGAEGDLGSGLHIKASDTSGSANSNADNLVIEENGNCGITMLMATNGNGHIYFGHSGDEDEGYIVYDADNNRMRFGVNAAEVIRVGNGGRISSNVTTLNHGLHINNANGSNYVTRLTNTSDTNPYGLSIQFTGADPDDNTRQFINCVGSGSVTRFQVDSDGDAKNHDNAYGSTSDEKLKEQIKDASSQWDDIKALKVRKFKFKDDVSKKGDSDNLWRLGVVAQELETAGMNGLVKDDPDTTVNEDNEIVETGTVTKSVKYSILYMKAVKALQEAMTRIETLEAKVKTLEE